MQTDCNMKVERCMVRLLVFKGLGRLICGTLILKVLCRGFRRSCRLSCQKWSMLEIRIIISLRVSRKTLLVTLISLLIGMLKTLIIKAILYEHLYFKQFICI